MPTRPARIAVIGAGPAGFYATGHLLDAEATIEVDLFDRLPTPWGLVRAGVAPDHPKIKAVSKVFEKIAAKPGFRMFGNVEIGRDISHAQLMEHYDAVIYSYGAQADRRMGIPGEDLIGSIPATAFVAWYNGHPDFYNLDPDLQVDRAVVIGNGNVAVDVARMLVLAPEELAPTDTGDHAIEQFSKSTISDVVIAGRRGPLQAAYTNPELLELGELQIADVIIDPAEAALDALSQTDFAEASKPDQRNVETVLEYAQRSRTTKPRTVTLRYLLSPLELRGDGRVEEIVMVRNRLERSDDGSIRAVATDQTETIPCGLVLRSVGYRGLPVEGVPFDEKRCVIPHAEGRALDATGKPVPGVYCTGWIKRGPSGVIGTNKKDAVETAGALLEDLAAGRLHDAPSPTLEAIEVLVADHRPEAIEYGHWESIDAHERALGDPHGRPRIKLCSWDELLAPR
ncbi:MAG: FAD-dependent oxidoreductase [Actinobacteria bacterium]|nr:FAD-dependent oxidoreductase [Actinomycetota bacterium]